MKEPQVMGGRRMEWKGGVAACRLDFEFSAGLLERRSVLGRVLLLRRDLV